MTMDFQHSARVQDYIDRLNAFMDEHVYPNEKAYHEYYQSADDRWSSPPLMMQLQDKAKAAGLWNLFMPNPEFGPGLSHLAYAPLAEIMGKVIRAPQVLNCNSSDRRNKELTERYPPPAQQERWRKVLLAGEIRSGFAMTEPDVASSDATIISLSIVRDGNDYVINGRKWFITGAMNSACKILIVMGKTDPDN